MRTFLLGTDMATLSCGERCPHTLSSTGVSGTWAGHARLGDLTPADAAMNLLLRALLLSLPTLALVAALSAGDDKKDPPKKPTPFGTIERKDPRFDKLIPKDAIIENLADGFDWAEGPVWVKDKDGGYLLFSDIPKNTVWKWQEGKGISLFLKPSGYSGDRTDLKEP